ncbi:MAG TPA: DUF5916 domain-containing protein [Bryobacterales bacterium]|nr:DUF5916 domain-containing protein [Bryobacterales bacterium]
MAYFVLLAIAFWTFFVLPLRAGPPDGENGHRRKVRAYRVDKPPTLDGLVNEDVWKRMEPAANFIQQQPDEGLPATEQTEVRIGFDDNNLYIGIICFDSEPENIVVTQNRRDAPLTDTDSVQILLDTFKDGQNAFVFGTSPTGIEYDAQVSKAGQSRQGVGQPARAGGQGGFGASNQSAGAAAFNLNWDAVWKVRSRITERGWESEMVIPFKTLRYRPGSGDVWGLNITRNLRRRNEQSFWSPLSRNFTLNQVEMAGDLEGLETKVHRNLKLTPYILGGYKQDYTVTPEVSKGVHDVGLDMKYSLTPSLTLDATFNTDFAQVEVDEQQINLTRFDLFFPEKRPFFLENSGNFDFGTPMETEIFFSRRIGLTAAGDQVPIDAGVRLTGKAGHYDLGFLNMKTREVEGITPGNDFTVLRVSREFANRSSLGVIGVNRQSTSHSGLVEPFNRTAGVDGNIGFGRYANLFSYVAKTQTPGLSGDDMTGSSAFEYDDEHHRIDLGYNQVGRNFNPEVGFVRRVGYRKPFFGYRYTYYPEGEHLRSIMPHFQWNRWYTLGTNDEESGFEHYHLDTRWQNGGSLGLAFNRNFERLDAPFAVFPNVNIAPGRYRYNEAVLNFGTDQTARFFTLSNLSIGHFYSGTIKTINFSGGIRRGQNLTWTGSYLRNFISLPAGKFNTDLIGFRFNWAFTPKSYFQSFIQYNSEASQVGVNLRVALLSTSSNGFFLVYNTRASTDDFLDPHDVIRTTQSRALFFKYTYLFDF